MKRKIGIAIVVLLIVIQFFHPKKNQSTELLATDITKVTTVPSEVNKILEVACNDCHSNNTRYPWYNNIQPVAWWLNKHINNGKRHLNFSEFGTYDAKKANHKLDEIVEVIEKDEMPLGSYTLIHKDAKLNETQKKLLTDWAKSVQVQ